MNSPFSVGTCQSLQSLVFYNGGTKQNFGTEKIQNSKKKLTFWYFRFVNENAKDWKFSILNFEF
jgi:hypothetical protein